MANKEITLTYLNIRQSISILLAKIIFIDIAAAVVVVLLYVGLVSGGNLLNYTSANSILFLSLFVLVGVIKVSVVSWGVLLWLNEYYEITPEYIVHKSGIIFRKSQSYRIDNIRQINVEDSLLGQIFNFGTITLYEIRREKYMDMYYIHNPKRYAKVLKQLNPNIEKIEDSVRIKPNLHSEEEKLDID